MEREREIWKRPVFLLVLMVIVPATLGQGCAICTRDDEYQTYNFWIEPPTAKDIHIRNKIINLRFYESTTHKEYAFVTKFYKCEEGKGIWISTTVQESSLANEPESSSDADLNGADPGKEVCHTHPSLFKFEDDELEDAVGSLRSASRGFSQFLDRAGNNLVFTNTTVNWEAFPALSKGITSAEDLRTMTTNQNMAVYVNAQQRLGIKMMGPGVVGFNFTIELFGFCKGYDRRGNLIQSRAILISAFLQRGRSRVRNYLQVAVTSQGRIALPFGGRHHQSRFPLRYNKIQLREDNARESRDTLQYSRYLRPNTNDEETIDERYFEVVRQRGGTYRITSTINPNLYMAIIRVGDKFELVITSYDPSLPTSIAVYDFIIDIPDAPLNSCAQQGQRNQQASHRPTPQTQNRHTARPSPTNNGGQRHQSSTNTHRQWAPSRSHSRSPSRSSGRSGWSSRSNRFGY